MGKKVLITSTSFAKVDSSPLRLLEKDGWEIARHKGPFSDEQLAALVPGFHAMIVGVDHVGSKTIAAGKDLRIIIEHGTGLDNIDIPTAEKAGIRVFNIPHTNATAVAEFAFAGLLSLIRRVPAAQRSLQAGKWEGPLFMGDELFGKTMGIVGLGHIGQKTATIAKGFGMKVVYFDVFRNEKAEQQLGIRFAVLDELLPAADFIVLHTPLSPETRGLIGADEFSRMKRTSIIVNVARGGIVDEEALFIALTENWISGAVLDVFETEPVPPSKQQLCTLDNVLCTPHIAGYTFEAVKRTSLYSTEKLLQEIDAVDCQR